MDALSFGVNLGPLLAASNQHFLISVVEHRVESLLLYAQLFIPWRAMNDEEPGNKQTQSLSINQSINQSISQSINQSINQ